MSRALLCYNHDIDNRLLDFSSQCSWSGCPPRRRGESWKWLLSHAILIEFWYYLHKLLTTMSNQWLTVHWITHGRRQLAWLSVSPNVADHRWGDSPQLSPIQCRWVVDLFNFDNGKVVRSVLNTYIRAYTHRRDETSDINTQRTALQLI